MKYKKSCKICGIEKITPNKNLEYCSLPCITEYINSEEYHILLCKALDINPENNGEESNNI